MFRCFYSACCSSLIVGKKRRVNCLGALIFFLSPLQWVHHLYVACWLFLVLFLCVIAHKWENQKQGGLFFALVSKKLVLLILFFDSHWKVVGAAAKTLSFRQCTGIKPLNSSYTGFDDLQGHSNTWKIKLEVPCKLHFLVKCWSNLLQTLCDCYIHGKDIVQMVSVAMGS